MSFADLMSSSRGPGLIGMLFALFVIIGFGALYLLVFDESSMGGGGKSFASIVRDMDRDIEAKKIHLVSLEKKLASIPQLKETSAHLASTVSVNQSLAPQIANFEARISEIHSQNERFLIEVEDYKNEYRAAVRAGASGSKLETLKSADGRVYSDVEIRKVTAIGIEIRHKDGFKRINFAELPLEMQDYYQFDKNQMAAEREREALIRKKHNQAVAAAHEAADEAAGERRVQERELARQKRAREIAVKSAKLTSLQSEISQLQRDISAANSAADSARSSGRMHLNKAGPLRNRLSSKQRAYSRLQGEIKSLQAGL